MNMYKIKNEFKNMHKFEEFYGTEENNKLSLVISCVFFVFASAISALLISGNEETINNEIIIVKVLFGYLLCLLYIFSFFAFTNYFFSKKKNSNRFKRVKCTSFYLAVGLLGVMFIPVLLIVKLTEVTKFDNFYKYCYIYAIALGASLGTSTLIFVHIILLFGTNNSVNILTVAALTSFICFQNVNKFIVNLFRKFRRKKIDEITLLAIEKDLYILNFVIIMVITFITNVLNLENISKEIVYAINSAFTIYIAFDRLSGKWEKANKDYQEQKNKV